MELEILSTAQLREISTAEQEMSSMEQEPANRAGFVVLISLRCIFNPLRMRRRVTVVVLCVCLCVCLSVTTLVARESITAVQAWYQLNQHDTSKVSNTWISLKTLCSKVMALFTLRSARPYMKYCSYSTRIRIMTRKR